MFLHMCPLEQANPALLDKSTQEAHMSAHNIPSATPFHERHDDELLTLDEVAQILMTSENTVRWWRQIGTGPEFFKIGRRLYTTVGDLRRWIREQRLASRALTGTPKVG